jgi:hypothetical protein
MNFLSSEESLIIKEEVSADLSLESQLKGKAFVTEVNAKDKNDESQTTSIEKTQHLVHNSYVDQVEPLQTQLDNKLQPSNDKNQLQADVPRVEVKKTEPAKSATIETITANKLTTTIIKTTKKKFRLLPQTPDADHLLPIIEKDIPLSPYAFPSTRFKITTTPVSPLSRNFANAQRFVKAGANNLTNSKDKVNKPSMFAFPALMIEKKHGFPDKFPKRNNFFNKRIFVKFLTNKVSC